LNQVHDKEEEEGASWCVDFARKRLEKQQQLLDAEPQLCNLPSRVLPFVAASSFVNEKLRKRCLQFDE